jgi:hypothetical protein
MSQMLQFQDEVMMHVIYSKIRRNTHGIFLCKKPTEFLTGSYVLVKYRTGKPPTRAHTF